ncbi:MAG: ABC transporter ATP-binding protein [Leptospiraceae bacterium]|nr:ABC transporter ATP-binding protein [Leptospiraceae bacterium]
MSYSLHYKYRFTIGIFFALFTALFNAVSLTVLIPLFDALGTGKKTAFELELTLPEKSIIYKEKFFGESSLDGLEKMKLLIVQYKMEINENIKNMEPKEVVWQICKLIIPLSLLKLIFYLLSVYCIATSGYMATRDIRQELYNKVQSLPLNYFYKEKTGQLMSRIINDAEVVSTVISSNLRDAIINFFYVITHLVILMYLNLELLVLASVTVPIIIYPVTLFTKKITKSTQKFYERMADLNANIHELITGIRIIRSYQMEEYEKSKFIEINQKATHRNFKGQFYLQMAPSLVELTSSLVVLGFFAVGARLIFNGSFTQGEFMAFLLTLLFLLRPLTQLSQMVGKISQANVSGERIFEIIDRKNFESHDDPKSLKNPGKLKESIRFENVHFQYPESPQEVLRGINFTVRRGETIALVGASGGGKSTLMDLLPRFYNPTSGRILFDGVDIQDYSLSDLRNKIGIVTQDIFLFHGTVAENIAYGVEGAGIRDVIRAARLAHAHDFITEIEFKYNGMLGIRGLNLSGGQRQRLVIARALLRDPEILILDEATSALDSKSEKLVNEALDRLYRNRTTFIIAHRFSTIRKVKRILVIENGMIVEEGDHESLMALNGVYSRLYEKQFAAGVGI